MLWRGEVRFESVMCDEVGRTHGFSIAARRSSSATRFSSASFFAARSASRCSFSTDTIFSYTSFSAAMGTPRCRCNCTPRFSLQRTFKIGPSIGQPGGSNGEACTGLR